MYKDFTAGISVMETRWMPMNRVMIEQIMVHPCNKYHISLESVDWGLPWWRSG